MQILHTFVAASLILATLLSERTHAAAPMDFRFEGYTHSGWWRSEYLGRFDQVRPVKCNILVQGVSHCQDGEVVLHPEPIDREIHILTSASMLRVAFVAYHMAWERTCRGRSDEPMDKVVFQRTRNGVPIAEYTYHVRTKFYLTFRQNSHPDLHIDESIRADLEKLVKEEACGSDMLSLFEENLHRAVLKANSVQSERPGLEKTPLFASGCRQVVSELKARDEVDTACSCVRRHMLSDLAAREIFLLEDHFNRESFLITSVQAVGLKDRIAACLR